MDANPGRGFDDIAPGAASKTFSPATEDLCPQPFHRLALKFKTDGLFLESGIAAFERR